MNKEKSRAKKSLKAECNVLLEEYLQILHVYETETDKTKKKALKKYVHERASFYKERCYDNGYFEPTLID